MSDAAQTAAGPRRWRAGVWQAAVLAPAIVAAVWWTGWFRYDPVRVWAAVPRFAPVRSVHEGLGGRIAMIAQHPFLASVLREAGVAPREIEGIRNSGALASIAAVTRGETVCAWLPSGPGGGAEWVFATWAGWRGQWFRLGVQFGLVRGYTRMRLAHGYQGWHCPLSRRSNGLRLYLTYVDGILIGCTGRSPDTLNLLVRQLDTRTGTAPGWMRRTAAEKRSARDRIGFSWYGQEKGVWSKRDVVVDVMAAPAGAITLAAAGNWCPGLGVTNWSGDRAAALSLAAGLGAEAAGTVALPPSGFWRLLQWMGVSCLRPPLESVLAPDTAVLVAIFKAADDSRLYGFRVPAFLVGGVYGATNELLPVARAAFDVVNAERRWGIIVNHSEVAGQPAVQFAHTQQNVYEGFLGENEPPAAMQRDGLLLVGSNARILTQAIPATNPASAAVAWPDGAGAVAAFDAAAFADCVRQIADLVALVLTTQGKGKYSVERMRAARIRDSARFLALLGPTGVRYLETGDGFRLWVRFAPAPTPAAGGVAEPPPPEPGATGN